MLMNVDLGALSTANHLELRDNPLLSPSSFDGVRTFESVISGNAP
jgi:hypothetical protein